MTTSFKQLNVLVVHNSDSMRASITEMLHAFGFKWVTGATDSETAVERLALNHIDLIVADYDEDGLDGLQLTKMVRAAEGNLDPNLPIILVSLSPDNDLMEQAVNAGANAVLGIPIVAKDFYSVFCALLRDEQSQVRSTHYSGPNRRSDGNRSTHQKERRRDAILESFGMRVREA